MKILPMRKLDEIRGKMMVGHATPDELKQFLTYVNALEGLVEEASIEDFYGTEGWQHKLGIDD